MVLGGESPLLGLAVGTVIRGLKQFRRIATRYDKRVSSFMAMVQLAAAIICIPKFAPIV